jgi:hypothetical protein
LPGAAAKQLEGVAGSRKLPKQSRATTLVQYTKMIKDLCDNLFGYFNKCFITSQETGI